MKICVAQSRSIKGDIVQNVREHLKLIRIATSRGAEKIIFPELSITGYEPSLAKILATDKDDSRFDIFQDIADADKICIVIGAPIRYKGGIAIGAIIFQPLMARSLYLKKYLHPDEEAFFINGDNDNCLLGQTNMALAICFEIFVDEHIAAVDALGASIYIASVAKSEEGADQAIERLSELAKRYGMTILMANGTGQCDDYLGGGRSSIWNEDGTLLGQLDSGSTSILMIDTDSHEVSHVNL